jgi:hypothetical protein
MATMSRIAARPVRGMEEQAVQVRRSPGPGICATPPNAEDGRHGRLQDEPESPRPGEPFRDVRQEIP